MKGILLWVALGGLSVVGSASAAILVSTVDIVESESPASFSFSFSQPAGAGVGIVLVDCPHFETCTFDLTPPAALTSTDFTEIAIVQFTLTQPGTNQVSDQLSILGLSDSAPPVIHFSFASDTDVPGGGLGACTFGCLDETGTPQQVATASFGNSTGTLETVLIRVQSDRELTVPEPATVALLGVGLAGLGFSRRRNRS